MAVSDYPGFLIMCDHGVTGGPRCLVDRWRWLPDEQQWWPMADRNDSHMTVMDGDDLPDTWQLITGALDTATLRQHHEIACPASGCTRWAYRADDAEVQALLRLIVTDDRFLTTIPLSVNDVRIVVTLDGLRAARDTAVRLGLLVGGSC